MINRIFTLFLIVSLTFFMGCSEDSPTTSEPSYTIDDMVGTWEMDSHVMDGSMTMDIAIIISMQDEEDCPIFGGTYSNGTCVVSDTVAEALAELTCTELEGELSQTTLCSITQAETLCCSGSDSATLTITSDGDLTMVTNYDGAPETMAGSISINGTSITMILNDSSADPDSMTLTGTLSFSGDIATLSFLDNDFMDMLSSDDIDDEFVAALSSATVTYIMIMSKVAVNS